MSKESNSSPSFARLSFVSALQEVHMVDRLEVTSFSRINRRGCLFILPSLDYFVYIEAGTNRDYDEMKNRLANANENDPRQVQAAYDYFVERRSHRENKFTELYFPSVICSVTKCILNIIT